MTFEDRKVREEGEVERASIRAGCRLRDLEETAIRIRVSLRQLAQKAANNRLPTWYIDEIAQIADEITWTP
jgi:hypothetical protein